MQIVDFRTAMLCDTKLKSFTHSPAFVSRLSRTINSRNALVLTAEQFALKSKTNAFIMEKQSVSNTAGVYKSVWRRSQV